MNKNGNIIIIEDDEDERMFLSEAFDAVIAENNYKNKVVFLNNANEALKYLESYREKPFLIMSDINMPGMNGLDLRNKIFNDDRLSTLCIPYILFTNGADDVRQIINAYKLSIQGYFKKPEDLSQYKSLIEGIVKYWKNSLTPASF